MGVTSDGGQARAVVVVVVVVVRVGWVVPAINKMKNKLLTN